MHAKMPDTPFGFWVGFAVVALILIVLCRVSRRFYWAAVPASLFLLYQGWSFLHANVTFREAMVRELGYPYLVQFAGAYAVPVVTLALYAVYDFRFRRVRPA
jgi:hypothetical protein